MAVSKRTKPKKVVNNARNFYVKVESQEDNGFAPIALSVRSGQEEATMGMTRQNTLKLIEVLTAKLLKAQ